MAAGTPTTRRVAVVGSGVAGLTAAYLLQRRAEVTLYEADDRLGGHAHTHDVESVDGHLLAIDSGFIVHNRRTYPNLLRLYGELGVATRPTEMTMSVRCEGCGLEYAGARGPADLFARARAAAARGTGAAGPGARVPPGGPAAPDADDDELTSVFLRAGRYSRYFVRHPPPGRRRGLVVRPGGRWSTRRATCSPSWPTTERSPSGLADLAHCSGSRSYVARGEEPLAVRTATPVRGSGGPAPGWRSATATWSNTSTVVVATHADQGHATARDTTATSGGAGASGTAATTVPPTTRCSPRPEREGELDTYCRPASRCRARSGSVTI
jgi:predicted NAD/FAD-binding protein